MTAGIEYRLLAEGEVEAAAALAARVFEEFVAPLYSEEGRQEFRRYAAAGEIRLRHSAEHFTWVAEHGGRLVGMLHLRPPGHIAMLFVEAASQRQGVGRGLVGAVERWVERQTPPTAPFTVNASPNAVPAYARMGFAPVGPEETVRGIRFVPMARGTH